MVPMNMKLMCHLYTFHQQQYGAINPCEMNEFSDECEVWEKENGPYVKGDFMVKSNPRTKGR